MKKAVRHIRKILALIIGLPILGLGVILVPLPGPGLLICFVGLIILSFDFEWARKRRESFQAVLKKIIDDALRQYREEKGYTTKKKIKKNSMSIARL